MHLERRQDTPPPPDPPDPTKTPTPAPRPPTPTPKPAPAPAPTPTPDPTSTTSLSSPSTQKSTTSSARSSNSAPPSKETSSHDASDSQPQDSDPTSSQPSSTGTNVGIAVGVVILAALALIASFLFYKRRKRRMLRSKGEDYAMVEESGFFARWNTRRGRTLTTYKNELDAGNEAAASPMELDGTWTQHIKRKPVAVKKGTQLTSLSEKANEQEGAIAPSGPPPVPYASKPKPG